MRQTENCDGLIVEAMTKEAVLASDSALLRHRCNHCS